MISVGEVLRGAFQFGRELWKFNRKRERDQEDHYFPVNPERLSPPLRAGQCFYCRRWYRRPYPKRGCLGRPATLLEMP